MLDDPEWGRLSDRDIASELGVSHTFVAAMRDPEVADRQQAARDKSAGKKVSAKVESDSTPAQAPAAASAPAPAAPPTEAEQVAQEAHGDVGVAIRWPIGSVRPRPVEPGSSPELEVEPAPLGPEASSLPPGGFSSFEAR